MSKENPSTRLRTNNAEQFITRYLSQFQHVYSYSSSSFTKGLFVLSFICSLIVIGIGSLALIGWKVHALSRIPGFSGVGLITAVLFIMAGMSLALSTIFISNKIVSFVIRFVRDILVIVIFLVSSVAIIAYFTHVDLGLTKLSVFLTSYVLHNMNTANIMDGIGVNIAFFYCLWCLAILTLESHLLRYRFSQYVSLIAIIILAPTIVSYLYNINFVYAISGTKLSIPTTVSCFFLLFGTLIARPRQGLMATVVSDTAGGFMARKLLLATILIPLLLSSITFAGFQAGLYSSDYRLIILLVSTIVVFTIVVWRYTTALDELDTERQRSVQNMIFLSGTGRILASSLDYKTTLQAVADLAVSHIADWCTIDILQPDGSLQLIITAHRDTKKIPLVKKLRQVNPPQLKAQSGLIRVLHTGTAEIYPLITDETIAKVSKTEQELRLIKSVGFSSVMIVPIVLRNRALGAVSLVRASDRRLYNQSDLSMAEELANRTALALENARLYRQAKEATRLRDEFISIASHELKTPITSLKVYTQVVGQQLQRLQEEKLGEYIHKMDMQIDKLTKLIEDLLNISRMQVGKLSLEKEKFALAGLVEEIIEAMQPTLKQHKIEYKKQAQPVIFADRDRVGQIIINLITNAVKYSPYAKTIIITLKQEKEFAIVSVQDFGIGIEKKHVNKIFDRFYQVDNTRQGTFSGLGIGLYVSHEIAQRHGGIIEVVSTKNKGSTFYLKLPFM